MSDKEATIEELAQAVKEAAEIRRGPYFKLYRYEVGSEHVQFAATTNAKDEKELFVALTEAVGLLLPSDPEAITSALVFGFEFLCRLRNYKSDVVREQRVLYIPAITCPSRPG